jgi:glycosyltransferase involved in cell wall biosynthesis
MTPVDVFVAERPVIQSVYYGNPDWLPPMINQLRLLTDRQWRVDVLCREYERTWNIEYPPEARIERLASHSNSSGLDFLAFLVAVLQRSHTEARVVIGHDMHGFVAARLLGWRRRIPVVYHCHDFAEFGRLPSFGSRFVKLVEQLLARTADLVIVPDQDRAYVVQRALRLRRPPLVIANAPMCRDVPAHDLLRPALATRGFHFSRILLRQGRITSGHGIEATIRSMSHWSNPDWGFVLLGHGPEEDIAYFTDVARSIGVESRFVVLPAVSYDRVLEYTVGADVGHALYEPVHVNNRHIATASNKLMEYMAAGRAVIVSDTPALQDLVERNGCGVSCDVTDPKSIADAVNRLLGDNARSEALGAAGRDAFESLFCFDRQMVPFFAYLERLAEQAEKPQLRS